MVLGPIRSPDSSETSDPDHIRVLEKQLEQQNSGSDGKGHSTQTAPEHGSPSPSSSEGHAPSQSLCSWNDTELALLLAARLNLSPHAVKSITPSLGQLMGSQEECLGPGSSLHLIQQMVRSKAPQVHEGVLDNHSCFGIFTKPTFSQNTAHLAALVEKIPPRSETELLINSFFRYANWNVGLLETWIRTVVGQTFDFLHCPGSFPGNSLNPNWLCLFFATLASVPNNATIHQTGVFLTCSIAALRVAEDMQDRSPKCSSTLEGNLLTCLAMPLLSKRYASLGRLGEARRVLRVAESFRIDYDYEDVSWTDGEKYLRRLAWINLATWDRLYSLLLGRPAINLQRFQSTGSSEEPIPAYLSALHDLSLLAEEINELYRQDSCRPSTIMRLDCRLLEWEKTDRFGNTSGFEHTSAIKSLSTWFLFLRMKLHAKSISRDLHGIPEAGLISAFPSGGGGSKKLVDICVELIEMQCVAYDPVATFPNPGANFKNTITVSPSFDSSTENLLILLEACIALLLQLDHQQGLNNDIVDLLRTVSEIFHGFCSQTPRATAGNISYVGKTIIQGALSSWYLGGDAKSECSSLRSRSPSATVDIQELSEHVMGSIYGTCGNTAAILPESWSSLDDSLSLPTSAGRH
ncbi:hypothetical protein D9757_005621 [Collybiopsis confluens]|uniref:Transcription factor domain-containing protein n=1 Tax=Collybiopsis confluens TaxID=2823264 RepID=A0A8H5HSS4_9AGAR|nr:hypothetical protein D9757_005621 [Collybiopsis confluens]